MLPALLFGMIAVQASASTPAAWAAGDRAMRALCVKQSGLSGAIASAPVHFSDRTAKSVMRVTGRYRQAFMKGAQATMLCLYDRRTRQAEIVETDGSWAPTTGR